MAAFREQELDPHLTPCRLGRGLYLRTKWHLYPSSRFATIDMSRGLRTSVNRESAGGGLLCPFPLTTSPGPRPTSVPSGILIHPQYSTLQITGSTFLPSRGFRIVDLRVQAAVFAVSAKLEVAVCRPEVVSRPLYHAATCISP